MEYVTPTIRTRISPVWPKAPALPPEPVPRQHPVTLAAYKKAGDRTVDRYGQIPPYKHRIMYKKVLAYYRGYKKDGLVMLVVIAAPSIHASLPY